MSDWIFSTLHLCEYELEMGGRSESLTGNLNCVTQGWRQWGKLLAFPRDILCPFAKYSGRSDFCPLSTVAPISFIKMNGSPEKMEGTQARVPQTFTVLIEAQHGVKKIFPKACWCLPLGWFSKTLHMYLRVDSSHLPFTGNQPVCSAHRHPRSEILKKNPFQIDPTHPWQC